MLIFQDNEGPRGRRPSRREWLRLGALAGFGIAPAAIGRERVRADVLQAARKPGFGRAKSVIVVFASGGQSQIDMWDPKPEAPAEIRGAFDSIETSISGARFCEHMPRIAGIADQQGPVRLGHAQRHLSRAEIPFVAQVRSGILSTH